MRALIVFAAALVVSALIFPAAIGQLARARMGQQIREEGPAAHPGKAGTPTAGGLVFVVVAVVLYLAADRSVAGGFVLIALTLGAALGFVDDVSAIRGRRNLGLKARQKIVIQLATGALLGYLALRWGLTSQWVPFDGRHPISGWIMIVVSALAVGPGCPRLAPVGWHRWPGRRCRSHHLRRTRGHRRAAAPPARRTDAGHPF